MDHYIVIMRLDLLTKDMQPSPEQLEVYMRQYRDWVGGIAAQDKFVSGTGLSTEGKVLRGKNILTDGPFAEIKESVAGFIVIKAKDFEEAVQLANGCPTLNGKGNTVEVRRIVAK